MIRAAIQLAMAAALAGCSGVTTTDAPLVQRGYVWNRAWTPAIKDAVIEAQRTLAGVVVLGGEITTTGETPRLIKSSVDWSVFARDQRCGIALRIAPGARHDYIGRFASECASELMHDARNAGVSIAEFQLDFDSPQEKLSDYATWLPLVRAAVAPSRLVITMLPSWLGARDFRKLIAQCDGFVLQVHSVPLRTHRAAKLCDRALALRWISQAARYRKPFAVALPTYRCVAGYGESGRLIGVAMDSVQPAFPSGTRVFEMGADADEIAALIATLQVRHPQSLKELIWYRVPTAVDERNWTWPTLRAVMAGRKPAHRLGLRSDGDNPMDVVLTNDGEADERVQNSVRIRADRPILAADSLPGWRVAVGGNGATFSPDENGIVRLSPGERRVIGWLRYDAPAHSEMRLERNAAR